MTNEELFAALAAPFPPDRVSWRVGSVKKDGTAAMALAYIDARDVMDRFDAVCRPSGWERLHPHVDKTTTCEVRVKMPETGEWVVKCDGAGDTAVEAEKGSLSDSFKRAAVNWGVGRYLYDLPTPWVRIDQYKKILPEELSKLQAILHRNAPAAPRAVAVTPPDAEPSGPGKRKSAAQAKRDGDDVKVKADIAKCDREGLKDWHANFDSYTADLPFSWLDSVRDMLEHRLEELNAPEQPEAEEMDAAFRNAVGPASEGRVAGNGRDSAKAA